MATSQCAAKEKAPTKKTQITPVAFYRQTDVVAIARALLGKVVMTRIDGCTTGGVICETEAYAGITDKACHAYNNRRTKRTEPMYQAGGISYIYFCYGCHHLLNIVTHQEGTPHAVLIRAITPTCGIETMCIRRGKNRVDRTLTNGPGKVCQALGLTLAHNALPLHQPPLWIEEGSAPVSDSHISASLRIGVAYAKEDALLPYRFSINMCKIL